MKEDSKMAYSPLAMGIGSRYYDLHPIVFNALLTEEDWIKNRDGLNSLHHSVDQAHGLDVAFDAQSDAVSFVLRLNAVEQLSFSSKGIWHLSIFIGSKEARTAYVLFEVEFQIFLLQCRGTAICRIILL